MQVFFILFSVYFAIYQYINSKCLYRTHVGYYLGSHIIVAVSICIKKIRPESPRSGRKG